VTRPPRCARTPRSALDCPQQSSPLGGLPPKPRPLRLRRNTQGPARIPTRGNPGRPRKPTRPMATQACPCRRGPLGGPRVTQGPLNARRAKFPTQTLREVTRERKVDSQVGHSSLSTQADRDASFEHHGHHRHQGARASVPPWASLGRDGATGIFCEIRGDAHDTRDRLDKSLSQGLLLLTVTSELVSGLFLQVDAADASSRQDCPRRNSPSTFQWTAIDAPAPTNGMIRPSR
jgi:hypothetical protein